MSARPASPAAPFDVLVLVPPANGLAAVAAVLADLPAELSTAVLVGPSLGGEVPPVQSVQSLSRHTPLPLHPAENGTVLRPGHGYVSPPQMILEVRPGGRCAVTPPEGELAAECPQDRLLASLAVSCGSRALAVILGGEGRDGVTGARALRGVGGTVLVQDPATANLAELPSAVMEAGAADRVVSPRDLGRTVTRLLTGPSPTAPPGEAAPGRTRAMQASGESEEQAFLLRLSDALRPLADPGAIEGEACRLLAEHLDVDRAYYVEMDEAVGVARVARDWVRGGASSLAGEHRTSDFGWSVAILRRGECHVVADTQSSDLVPPEDRPASAALGIIACMGAPLIKAGRLVGALCVTAAHPRVWQEGEVELLREMGERVWAAVERARSEQALAESEEKYRTLFQSMDQGYCDAELVRDAGGRVVDVRYLTLNPAFERMFGIPVANAVGRLVREIVPDLDPWWLEPYDRIATAGVPERLEHEVSALGRWFEVYVSPRGGDRLTVLYEDITERKRAEQRQAFLLRLSDALRPLRDATAIQQAAIEVLGAHLNVDRAFFTEVLPDGDTVVTRTDYLRGVPSLVGTMRLSDFGPRVREAYAAGKTVVTNDVLVDWSPTDAERAAYASIQFVAGIGVPLVKEGRLLGIVTVHMATPRAWRGEEVSLLEDVAERTWTAVERAREETLRQQAEELNAFLVRFTDAVRTLTDPEAVAEVACGLIAERLGVERAYWAEVDWTTREYVIGPSVQVPGVPVIEGRFPVDAWEPFTSLHLAGLPVVVNDTQADERIPPEVKESYVQIAVGADLAVPVVVGGKLRCTLAANQRPPRHWSEAEVALVRGLAGRCWSEVERARAEAALTESEGRLRALVEHLPGSAVFVVDHDLRYVLAQGEALAPANFTPEDLIGRTVAEAMGPELAPGYEALYRQALAGEGFDYEHAAHGRTFVTRGVPLRNAAGNISAALAVSYDITARKRAEEALRKNQERQAFLLGLSDTLRPLADPSAVQSEAARVLGRHLGASRASYAEVEADDAHFVVHRDYTSGVPSYAGRYLLDAFGPGFVRDLRAGRTVMLADAERDARVSEAERTEVYAAGAIRAFIGVPLVKGGRLAAVFSLHFPTAHEWTPDEVALVEEVAERTWAAVERARAEEELRALNATLEERVEERTRRLATLNAELASRTRALEAFAELTRDLAPHLDPHALIRRGQEIALSLLPGGFSTYYEPEGPVWRLRAQVGDMCNPALQAAVDAGLPVGGTPSLDRPWASGVPLFQGQYGRDTDGLGELRPEVDAAATFPLTVDGVRLGLFAVALFSERAWSAPDRAVLETVVHSLGLALERAAAVRALAEEREALAAFAHFTERAADTREVAALVRQATEVLGEVLDVDSAVYFEREGEVWRLRHASGSLDPDLKDVLGRGVPAGLPGFALPEGRREPLFFEHWDPGTRGMAAPVSFTAVAAYPLFPPDHPAGMLSMAVTNRPTWTEREKAVFRAVGDSFRLALERAARTQQIERQRERLADLNAELGNFITRTAHTLEAPARRLGHLMDPGRALDPGVPDGLFPYDPAALHDEVTRLRGVAQDLRQLARLEQQDVAKDLLPLGELFAEVQAQVSATPRGKQVYWLTGPLPIVRGDRALLKQALEVLMTFTLSEARGARYVTVESREVEGEVQVTVEDDGLGLTGEEAATLFDLAVRTDQQVPVLEGSGLVQVRRILARHGGWTWAEAQLSSGKIVLALPRDEAVQGLEALFRRDKPGQ
ncbi:GAF domain-containing protein [Deinococcus aestuarii]|uniref:GAF domain-containing protein n=1 Tax=Deinococcus aestuarii TaxID=2774531 RepID=UPI001C0C6AF8|nr:GAF domain-containing protein [Deinococcus aestuarii]